MDKDMGLYQFVQYFIPIWQNKNNFAAKFSNFAVIANCTTVVIVSFGLPLVFTQEANLAVC